MNDNIVNVFLDFNDLNLLLFHRDNLFTELINLFDFSVNNFNRDHLFNDSIDWNLNFNRHYDFAIDLNYFGLFNNIGDDLFHFNSSGYLSVLNHNSFRDHFLNFSVFLVNLISD